jgi:hypothetical protein
MTWVRRPERSMSVALDLAQGVAAASSLARFCPGSWASYQSRAEYAAGDCGDHEDRRPGRLDPTGPLGGTSATTAARKSTGE